MPVFHTKTIESILEPVAQQVALTVRPATLFSAEAPLPRQPSSSAQSHLERERERRKRGTGLRFTAPTAADV
uniref:Uncharacterized protein n=1 Tax=Plectus sambesii TaxID=2011161 RepID=A0A914WSK1_9BILA